MVKVRPQYKYLKWRKKGELTTVRGGVLWTNFDAGSGGEERPLGTVGWKRENRIRPMRRNLQIRQELTK